MTAARDAAEFIESAGLPTTTERTAAEFIESAGLPTTAVRTAALFIEVAVGAALFHPLRLFPRNDDLDGPRLPQFFDSTERSARLGGGDSYA